MPLFTGAQGVAKIYRGALPIARAYRGATLVFDRASENLHATDTSGAESVNRNTESADANDGSILQ